MWSGPSAYSMPLKTKGYWMTQIPPLGFWKRMRLMTRLMQPSTLELFMVELAVRGLRTLPSKSTFQEAMILPLSLGLDWSSFSKQN